MLFPFLNQTLQSDPENKAPSVAEIRLDLSETEMETGSLSGSVTWLVEELNIEKSQ